MDVYLRHVIFWPEFVFLIAVQPSDKFLPFGHYDEVLEASEEVLAREREYHENLYSGFAQRHFAMPAVRAFREHLARRIRSKTGISTRSRVLSLGCGIGDTEVLLAPHASEVVGIDLSPTAVRAANQASAIAGVPNFRAWECTLDGFDDGRFDVIIGVFFLHHLTDPMLVACADRVHTLLNPGGVFYSLDPSRYRLSGFVGARLFPSMMARFQTADERQLAPALAKDFFAEPRFNTVVSYYDFVSTPLAGLLPGSRTTYLAARAADELLIRTPGLRYLSSNFELTAFRR
jgi:SAM-dependent methyltransferase